MQLNFSNTLGQTARKYSDVKRRIMRTMYRRPFIVVTVVIAGMFLISYLVVDNNLNEHDEPDKTFENFIARRQLYAMARKKTEDELPRDNAEEDEVDDHSDAQSPTILNPQEDENQPHAHHETRNTLIKSIQFESAANNKNIVKEIPIPRVRESRPVFDRTNCSSGILSDDVFIRNCLTGDVIGRRPGGTKTSPIRGLRGTIQETGTARRRSFEKVFETRAWGHGWDPQNTGLNASGMGATLMWTQELIGTLHVLIDRIKRERGVSRVRLLDVPCGDMAWMSRFLKTRDDIDYTGVDIVTSLIEHHQKTFIGQKSWKFERRDILDEPFTGEAFDVILCRTLMQHLYLNDVMKLLKQFSDSGSSYLLTTSFDQKSSNVELEINAENPGRFRQLNLQVPPISLTPPRCIVRDGPPDAFEGYDHFIGLWALPLRQVRLCKVPVRVKLINTETPIDLFSCTDWSLKN